MSIIRTFGGHIQIHHHDKSISEEPKKQYTPEELKIRFDKLNEELKKLSKNKTIGRNSGKSLQALKQILKEQGYTSSKIDKIISSEFSQ